MYHSPFSVQEVTLIEVEGGASSGARAPAGVTSGRERILFADPAKEIKQLCNFRSFLFAACSRVYRPCGLWSGYKDRGSSSPPYWISG